MGEYDWEKTLAKELSATGQDNALEDDISVDEAMRKIAKPIAKAIVSAGRFRVLGRIAVSELNEKSDLTAGDVYTITDGGWLKNSDGSYTQVDSNEIVIYQDDIWVSFVKLSQIEDCATKTELASVSFEIAGHVADNNNPHKVSAEQVLAVSYAEQTLTDDEKDLARKNIDALSESEIMETYEAKEDAKSKANSYGLLMRANGTNTLQFCRPSIT